MQWLVYVHNQAGDGASREAAAVLGDDAALPRGGEPESYARVWVDQLAPDIGAEIERVLRELYAQYPPLEGLPSSHMTDVATIELLIGPGFSDAETVTAALLEALGTARQVA